MRFKNKTVIVTGSSRGLGAHIVKAFAEEGANVVVNYSNSSEKAKEVVNNFPANTNYILVKADVSNIDDVRRMYDETLQRFGTVDILVNNAAIYEDSSVWKMSEEIWDSVLDIDLKGVFNNTKFASKIMRENKFGRIINISSVVGQVGIFGTSNYSAAKAGVLGFTRATAVDLASNNITVNAVTLGYIEEGMLLRLPEKFKEQIITRIPIGRWGKVSEVIETIFFLCSSGSGYITGQTINVNGGCYM